uniref:Uncharacterized protein n=1 Tax=Anguilla anguilla TaxID=7936 RepID=A0A0E9TPL7_ANGAN
MSALAPGKISLRSDLTGFHSNMGPIAKQQLSKASSIYPVSISSQLTRLTS